MARYDAAIIHKFASKLYSRANSIILIWTLMGLIAGGAGGAVLNAVYTLGMPWIPYGCAATLALIGYAIGTERAFALKLQAQVALCQMEIERNTRPA